MSVRCWLVLALTGIFLKPVSANTSVEQFPEPSAAFGQHTESVYQYIYKRSLPGRSDQDIKLNLPFELSANPDVPYRVKFLLFHGLNDSTYVWADIAKSLSERGFDVRAVLLPGHGSHPDQMLDISYKSWFKAARQHLQLWYQGQTPIYLGGFSLGGVIATVLALENPDIAGLFLVSPAYESKLKKWLRWSWIYARFEPYMFGGLIIEDNPIKYNSIPINSATQYYNTTKYLKRRWKRNKLTMPVAAVITMQDSVVDVEYVREIFHERFTSPKKRLLIYSEQQGIETNNNEFIRQSYYPELRILNQSHLSMINTPENYLLGESRKILICNGNEYPVFMACMRSRQHWYGAQHTPSPDGTAVARTTYNPDYQTVEELIEQVFF